MTNEQIAHDIAVALAVNETSQTNTTNAPMSAVSNYRRFYPQVLRRLEASSKGK